MPILSLVTRILIIVFGILLPARSTHTALNEPSINIWAKYWIVYACLVCIECLSDTFIAWMPLYIEGKLLFVLWLVATAPQASLWLFDAILNPLLVRNMQRINNFMMLDKRQLANNALTVIANLSRRFLYAVLPMVSKTWRKFYHGQASDSAAVMDTDLKMLETDESNDAVLTQVEAVTNLNANIYFDAHVEEESYDVTYPSSQSQTVESEQIKKPSRHSLPDLAKKLMGTGRNAPAARPKRKQYIYDPESNVETVKELPEDVEEMVKTDQLSAELAQLPYSHRQDLRQRYK